MGSSAARSPLSCKLAAVQMNTLLLPGDLGRNYVRFLPFPNVRMDIRT